VARSADLQAFTPAERRIIRRCRTPAAAQAFLNGLPYNTEPPPGGATLRSFRGVVRHRSWHGRFPHAHRTFQFNGRRGDRLFERQSQRHSCIIAGTHEDVMLPLGPRAARGSAQIVGARAQLLNAEPPLRVAVQHVRRFAIRRLPQNLRPGNRRAFRVDHLAAQAARLLLRDLGHLRPRARGHKCSNT